MGKVRFLICLHPLCGLETDPSDFVVVPDGYGLSYGIGADYIRWTITSLKKDSDELKHHLAEAATEVRAMMENAAKEAESTHHDAPVKAKL